MKLKKNLLLTFSAFCIIFSAIFLYSCNKEEKQIEQSDSIETISNKLAASKELQDYQKTVNIFVKELKNKYSKLSKSDREKFNQTLSSLTTENYKNVFEESSQIIGINLESNLNKINSKLTTIRDSENNFFSQEVLTIAIVKYNSKKTNLNVRLKSGSESSGDPIFDACMVKCTEAFTICTAGAALAGSVPAMLIAEGLCIASAAICTYDCYNPEPPKK